MLTALTGVGFYRHSRGFTLSLEEFFTLRLGGKDRLAVRLAVLMGRGAGEGKAIVASEGFKFYARVSRLGCFTRGEFLLLDDREVVGAYGTRQEAEDAAARFRDDVSDGSRLVVREVSEFAAIVAALTESEVEEVFGSGEGAGAEVPSEVLEEVGTDEGAGQSESVYWTYWNGGEVLVVDQFAGRVVSAFTSCKRARAEVVRLNSLVLAADVDKQLEVVRVGLSLRYRVFEEQKVYYLVDQVGGAVVGVYVEREEAEDAALELNDVLDEVEVAHG